MEWGVPADPEAAVEAALYAAGRPLDSEELARAAGLRSRRRAVELAKRIATRVNVGLKALEVVEYPGHKFALQLRPQWNRLAKKFATKPLVPPSVLVTLSYVAFHQPISAQQLALRRGSKAYSHLKLLEATGLVESQRSGRTRLYKTTNAFAEYFGLSSDPEVLKKELFSGIRP